MEFEAYSRDELIQEIKDLRKQVSAFKELRRTIVEKHESYNFELAQLLSIFDGIQQIIYVADPFTYEVLYMNNFGKELFGKDPLGGICYREFQNLEHPCPFCTNDIILKQKGEPHQWEFQNDVLNKNFLITDRIIRWPDGRDVRMEFTIDITELHGMRQALQESYYELEDRITHRTSELREANERLLEEIQEREAATEALRQSEARMELALRGADLGAWDFYPQSGEVIFNERWGEMLGYSLGELEPNVKTWESLAHPEDLPKVLAILKDHMDGLTPFYEAEHRLLHKSGEWRWILDKGKVVDRSSDGTPLRMAGTHLDITDKKIARASFGKVRQRIGACELRAGSIHLCRVSRPPGAAKES